MQPYRCFKSDFVKAFGLHPGNYKLFFLPIDSYCWKEASGFN